MFKKFTTGQDEIWGVFLGLDRAHLTRIKGGSFHRHNIDNYDMRIDQITRKTYKARRVITAIGSKDIFYKNAILPGDINDGEIKEAARWQFHEIENISEYEITYKKTDFKPDGNINVICIAIPKQLIESFGETYNEIFTDLDLRPFAIWRGYKLTSPGSEPIILAVNNPDGLTVVCGRNKVEYIREIPISLNLDLEKMRTVTYYRRAFDAENAVFVDIDGDQAAPLISTGCALAFRDTSFNNLLPVQYQRATLNIGQSNRTGLIAALCAAVLFFSCIPYGFCCWHNKETTKQQEIINRYSGTASQVDLMKQEISEYNRINGLIKDQFVSPYTLILDNIRYATPVGIVLEKLEVNEKGKMMLNTSSQDKEANSDSKEKEEKKEPDKKQDDDKNQQDEKQEGSENDKNQESEKQPQKAVSNKIGGISCRPDALYISGKSADIKSIGLFTDNLLQLGYIKNIIVSNIKYDNSRYEFNLTADINYGMPSKEGKET